MKRQTSIAMIIVASSLLPLTSPLMGADRTEKRGQIADADWKFVTEAAEGGMAEVRLGQLAKQKGASQTVRDFGERMITDHSKANDELKTLVANKGGVLPAELSHKHTSHLDKLQKSNGSDFDKEFAEMMVKDHKTDIKEFEDAAKDLKDPELKAFVQKTLPTLQEHLRMAQEMEAAVKK